MFESGLKERLSSCKYLDFPIPIFRFLFLGKGISQGRGTASFSCKDFPLPFFPRGWDKVLINCRGTERSIKYPVLMRCFLSKSPKFFVKSSDGVVARKQRYVHRLMISFTKETTNPCL